MSVSEVGKREPRREKRLACELPDLFRKWPAQRIPLLRRVEWNCLVQPGKHLLNYFDILGTGAECLHQDNRQPRTIKPGLEVWTLRNKFRVPQGGCLSILILLFDVLELVGQFEFIIYESMDSFETLLSVDDGVTLGGLFTTKAQI